jgi:hypothetical protein
VSYGKALRRLSTASQGKPERVQMALRTAGGVLIFLGFDASVRWVIDTSGMSMLPSQICSALVGPNGSLIGTGVLVFLDQVPHLSALKDMR